LSNLLLLLDHGVGEIVRLLGELLDERLLLAQLPHELLDLQLSLCCCFSCVVEVRVNVRRQELDGQQGAREGRSVLLSDCSATFRNRNVSKTATDL
jgi:hypothetical protein